MKLHLITSLADMAVLTADIARADTFPLTVAVYKGKTKFRSLDQNALAWAWYGEIARHRGDMTVDEVHRECKLVHGVPILRAENPEFCAKYDAYLKPIGYEEKLAFMPFLSVSSIFTAAQMTRYLEAIQRAYAEQGLYLESNDG